MKVSIDETKAKEALENGLPKAKEILKDENKIKKLIEDIEKKIKNSKLNEMIETVTIFVSCLKSYMKGEYKEIPVGTILAMISALLYWISPVDLIPDFIPGIGQVDDAAVVLVCLTMVKTDFDDYKKWLAQQNK